MSFWESRGYFLILNERMNYIIHNQRSTFFIKTIILNRINSYFIYRIFRKVLKLQSHTDFCFLVNKAIRKSASLKILDIGGGIGENYFELQQLQLKNIDYYVHDSHKLFIQGHELRLNNVRKNDLIIHSDTIHNYQFQFDLLLLNGSIQYLKDFTLTVDQLKIKPRDIILDRTLLSFNSFTANQINEGGYTTKYNVFSEIDLIDKFKLLGYALIQTGNKRKHKIMFDDQVAIGYYKAMHFRAKL
jgi:putative methyltransferase (TIGR04325 family)